MAEKAAEADFFISRAAADADFAAAVGSILETAGYHVYLQQWDFANRNFMECMQTALDSGARVIALLSPAYFKSDHCMAEVLNTIGHDALNKKGRLILLRLEDCKPTGVFTGLSYWDLVPLRDQPTALRDAVLSACGKDQKISSDEKNSSEDSTFHVFLSHSSSDNEIVEQIGIKIIEQEKLKVWLDRWQLVPGENWQPKLASGISNSNTCAVFLGSKTPRGWFKEEIEKALNRQAKDSSFRVIPVLLPGSDPGIFDSFLELRTWVDFRNGIDDDHVFHDLVCAIKGVVPGPYKKNQNKDIDDIRKKLTILKQLHQDELIDREIAVEYQRTLLNEIINRAAK